MVLGYRRMLWRAACGLGCVLSPQFNSTRITPSRQFNVGQRTQLLRFERLCQVFKPEPEDYVSARLSALLGLSALVLYVYQSELDIVFLTAYGMGLGQGEGTAAYCLYKCTKFKSPFRGSICRPKVPTPPPRAPVPGPSSRSQVCLRQAISIIRAFCFSSMCLPSWTWSCLRFWHTDPFAQRLPHGNDLRWQRSKYRQELALVSEKSSQSMLACSDKNRAMTRLQVWRLVMIWPLWCIRIRDPNQVSARIYNLQYRPSGNLECTLYLKTRTD